MHSDYDILIIGGGLVGASLACALAPSGLRLGVVEAVPAAAGRQPGDDERTIALAFGSRRIFEAIGVWGELARRGACPIERIHVSDRGRFGAAWLTCVDLGLPALGYVVENRALAAALWESLRDKDRIELLCPATLESVEYASGQAAATIRQGKERRTLTARLVAAADGADSPVRAAAGIAIERIAYGQTALVASVATGRPHGNTAYERFTATGPLAFLPMSNGRCAVVWSARAGEVEAMLGWSDAEFLARLQERFGERLGAFSRPGKRRAYPLALTRVREHVRHRLALIGNAAHTVHPVAGQGFNLGLRDVAALAEVVTRAARAGEDIGSFAVLERYASSRTRDNRVTQAFTHGLVRLFASDSAPLACARSLALVALDLTPPAKRFLVRISSGLAGRLPRLARGLPL
jgi:2-octaprenyl-6-methoxyphenol hydroxylase